MTVEQACCELKSFCCNLDKDKKPHLKSNHDYYFQVQGQMAITGIHKCDFVVWIPKDVFVQNIPFDSQFWNKYLPKLKYFSFILYSLKLYIISTLLQISMTILVTSPLCTPIINLCVSYKEYISYINLTAQRTMKICQHSTDIKYLVGHSCHTVWYISKNSKVLYSSNSPLDMNL